MTESELDKKLKERLDTYSEAAPDVWEGIAAGLAARRRRVVFRRVSFAVAAAAACLVAGILVFRDPVPAPQPAAPQQTAQVQPVPSVAPAPAVDLAPIAEQVAAFTQHQSVAAARPRINVRQTVPASPKTVAAPETVTEPAEAQPSAPAANPAAEAQQAQEAQPAVQLAETKQLGQEDLPADFWSRSEAEESRPRNAHTSQISILSNLTAVASEKAMNGGFGPSHSSSQSGSKQPSGQFEPAGGTPKFYAPLSIGVQFKAKLTDRLYLGSGLSYSYLVSRYDLLVDKQLFTDAYNQLHYLGIPLTLSYNFVDTRYVNVYGSIGGAAEKCISQRYVYGSKTGHEKVGGLQWSVAAGVGVEYWFIPRLGIYFDPSLVYFFDNSQPLSIRTQQPLQARFEVGFRVKLSK